MLHTVYVGVQRHSPADACAQAADAALAGLHEVLWQSQAQATDAFDIVAGDDTPGARMLSATWSDSVHAADALGKLDLAALYARLGDWRHSVGLWMEWFTTPIAALDAVHRSANPLQLRVSRSSLPKTLAIWEGEVPEPAPEPAPRRPPPVDILGNLSDVPLVERVPTGYGERVSGSNLQALMHVRSAYIWAWCGEVESRLLKDGLLDPIDHAFELLRRDPLRSGAYGMRQCRRLDEANLWLPGSGMIGFMRDAGDVARWNEDQAACVAAFQGVLDKAQVPEADRRLHTYAEMTTVAPGEAHFEYINCGPHTGVLRMLPMERRRLPIRFDLR